MTNLQYVQIHLRTAVVQQISNGIRRSDSTGTTSFYFSYLFSLVLFCVAWASQGLYTQEVFWLEPRLTLYAELHAGVSVDASVSVDLSSVPLPSTAFSPSLKKKHSQASVYAAAIIQGSSCQTAANLKVLSNLSCCSIMQQGDAAFIDYRPHDARDIDSVYTHTHEYAFQYRQIHKQIHT